MPRMTFIEHDGTTHEVDAQLGDTIMQTATRYGIPGIVAECGGNCSCATCHVYIDPAWRAGTGSASPMEAEMIDCALHVQEGSRLSCQIQITSELDGLIVRIPESQT